MTQESLWISLLHNLMEIHGINIKNKFATVMCEINKNNDYENEITRYLRTMFINTKAQTNRII